MSDSTENTKDIDSYGVWVKRPPQDAAADELDLENDLPDFSDLDNFSDTDNLFQGEPEVADNFSFDALDDTEDTALSAEELSNISEDFTLEETTEEAPVNSESLEQENAEPKAEEPSGDTSFEDMLDDLPDFGDLNIKSEESKESDSINIPETSEDNFSTEAVSEDAVFEEIIDNPTESIPEESIDIPTESIPDAEFNISSENETEDTNNSGTTSAEEASEEATSDEVDLSDFDISSQEDGEISLDDFMDGGFSDPTPGTAPSPASSATESIPTDDFMSDEISLDDFLDEPAQNTQKEDDITNDDPLDINVDFSQEEIPTQEVIEETEEEETESSDSSESSFDDMFNGSGEGMTSSELESEELSLSDFGVDENSDDATAVAAGNAINSSAEEEIDLSDFGIDSDAEETPVEQDVQGAKKNEKVDYDLAITDDDEASVEAPTAQEVTNSAASIEEVTPVEEEPSSNVSNKLLEQIISDLSGLKNEINSLKGDLETLKSKEYIPSSAVSIPQEPDTTFDSTVETTSDEKQAEIIEEKVELPEDSSVSSGFFNNDDEDETIALSGSELDNIMNTVDFSEEEEPVENDSVENSFVEENSSVTEEDNSIVEEKAEESAFEEETHTPQTENIETEFSEDTPFNEFEASEVIVPNEEHDSGLSMEFTDENLEEPNLDDIDNIDPEAQAEIQIPGVNEIANEEDEVSSILVESSSEDLMSTSNDASPLDMPSDEIVSDETNSIDSDIAADEESFAMVEDMLKEDPPVSEQISDENMDYLSEEPVQDEFIDDEIPTVAGIMAAAEEDKNEAADETEIMSETIPENDTEATTAPVSAPAFTETTNQDNKDDSFPEDLKSDVKSVLLYMDQLLENLPEDKIVEFAKSEQFATYKKLFNELGLS